MSVHVLSVRPVDLHTFLNKLTARSFTPSPPSPFLSRLVSLSRVTAFIRAFVLFFLFLFAPATAALGSPRIENVTTEVMGDYILVSASLTGGFQKETVDDIHNGIPKNFYYYLVLQRKEKRWFDEEVLSKTILYTVKYDTLKKSYQVTQTLGEKSIEKQVSDFKAMKEIVTKIERIKLTSVETLKKRDGFYVSVKSQMQAAKRPFYLDYFLFFIPFLEIDTPWVDSPPIRFSQEK